MTTLVAVAFPDETTASAAAEDVRRLALDVSVDMDAMAVVSRDRDGALHLTTTHRSSGRTPWAVFWVLLVETLGSDRTAHEPGRWGHRPPRRADPFGDGSTLGHDLAGMLEPRTSILLLAVEDVLSDEAVRGLTRLGGVLVTWGLRDDPRQLVRAGLDGDGAVRPPRRGQELGDRAAQDGASPWRAVPLALGTCGAV